MSLRPRSAIVAAVAIGVAVATFALVRARLKRPRVEPLVTASGRSLTGFCAAAVQLHCDKRLECGQMDPPQRAACLDEVGAECERTVGWKLRAGVVTAGGEPEEECFEAMGEAGCNALQFLLGDDEPSLFEITDRCEIGEMFRPQSALGGPCAETSDCRAGFCPGLAPECHRCRPYVADGGPCVPGELACDPATSVCARADDGGMRCQQLLNDGARCGDPHQCRSGVCRRGAGAVAPGECVSGATGTNCTDASDCSVDLYCRLEAGRRSCAPRVKTFEPCSEAERVCAEAEARCVGGHCRVRPHTLGAGDGCREFSDCKDGLYCQGSRGGASSGRCARQGGLLDACEPLDYGACRTGSTCGSGRCRRLRSAGEKCWGNHQCKAFLSCVPTSLERGLAGGGACVADSAVGERCNQYLRCVVGYCDPGSGRCLALAGGGAPCGSSQQCDSQWCVGQPGAAVCYAPCAGSSGPAAKQVR